MKVDDKKTLYARYYAERYRQFILSNQDALRLRAPSRIPGIAISSVENEFTKKTYPSPTDDGHKIQAILKNKKHHALLWETSPQKLKEATRWGIIKTESMTGRVISSLGHYRVLAHERVYHGMVSDTQALKLALLDNYQDRFEALQALESLVNKYATKDDFTQALTQYITTLKHIKTQLQDNFSALQLEALNYPELTQTIADDIDEAIKKAVAYQGALEKAPNPTLLLKQMNRARGDHSILEFVKQQMHANLYTLQGLNQDVVFRVGALTRGEFNDCIEDARKSIDEHTPDLRNAITAQHHGNYQARGVDDLVVYDFSQDDSSPERERQALLAISFIEGYERVDYTSNWNTPYVIKKQIYDVDTKEDLTKIIAPKWSIHRLEGVWNNLSYLGGYLWHLLQSALFKTQPYEQESWSNSEFSLHAKHLRDNYSKPNYPSWYKAWQFSKQVGVGVKDIFLGVYNAVKALTVQLPDDLLNDWESTKPLASWKETSTKAEQELNAIQTAEELVIDEFKTNNPIECESLKTLAKAEYSLTKGEENDILTAIVQGVNGFSSLFTHNLFAKDPVGSLLFSTAFAVGGASIFFPLTSKMLFGASYVNSFTAFSKLVGSTPLSQALCGGLLQAQAIHMPFNLITEGRHSALAHSAQKLVDDPLTLATGFGFSYGLGYLLANGFLGYKLPVLSELISHELGSSGLLNYPVIGVKLGVGCVYILVSDDNAQYYSLQLRHNNNEFIHCDINLANKEDSSLYQELLEKKQQVDLVVWLSTHASNLPKLPRDCKLALCRQIEKVFSADKNSVHSLQQLIYPKAENHSIAFQLIAIPLKYIPLVARFFLSFAMSAIAWLKNNPHAEKPITRAADDLFQNAAKDINRLVTVCSNALYGLVNGLASPFKALAYVGIMFIGRVAAFFDGVHIGSSLYQGLGWIHALYRKTGAALYPERTMKSVVTAHPAHTVNAVMESYETLVARLEVNNKVVSTQNYLIDSTRSQSLFTLEKEPRDRANYGIGLDHI